MVGGAVVDGRTWSRGCSKVEGSGERAHEAGWDGRPSGGTAEALIGPP